MRELTLAEISQVSGGLSSTEKTLIGLTLLCPVLGAMAALGYYANKGC